MTVQSGNPTVVYYRPPNNFFFGKDNLRQNVDLTLTDVSAQELCRTSFDIVRPTIILSHGLNSSPAAMRGLQFTLQGRQSNVTRVNVLLFDYAKHNTDGFNNVALFIRPFIREEISKQRSQRIAATRIDWLGHSLGGVVARWYCSDIPIDLKPNEIRRGHGFDDIIWTGQTYRRRDNFGVGEFRRLVTLGSPLRGSPIADVTQQAGRLLCQAAVDAVGGANGNAHALSDLAISGTAIFKILQNQHPTVSWLPIVGRAAPGRDADDLAKTGLVSLVLEVTGLSLQSILNAAGLTTTTSDLVVNDWSQVDSGLFPPLPGKKYRLIESVTHTEEPDNVNVGTVALKAFDLLFDSPADSNYVAGYTLFNSGF